MDIFELYVLILIALLFIFNAIKIILEIINKSFFNIFFYFIINVLSILTIIVMYCLTFIISFIIKFIEYFQGIIKNVNTRNIN